MAPHAIHTLEELDGRTLVKSAMVRSTVDVLRKRGHYARIAPLLDPKVRALLEDPPPSSAWVDFGYTEHLSAVVEHVVGLQEARVVSLESIRAGFPSIIDVFVRGLLRLFGSTPSAVFTRLAEILPQTTRGMEVTYDRTGERSGVIRSRYVHRARVHEAPLRAWLATADLVFDLCGVKGTVEEIPRAAKGSNEFSVRVSW